MAGLPAFGPLPRTVLVASYLHSTALGGQTQWLSRCGSWTHFRRSAIPGVGARLLGEVGGKLDVAIPRAAAPGEPSEIPSWVIVVLVGPSRSFGWLAGAGACGSSALCSKESSDSTAARFHVGADPCPPGCRLSRFAPRSGSVPFRERTDQVFSVLPAVKVIAECFGPKLDSASGVTRCCGFKHRCVLGEPSLDMDLTRRPEVLAYAAECSRAPRRSARPSRAPRARARCVLPRPDRVEGRSRVARSGALRVSICRHDRGWQSPAVTPVRPFRSPHASRNLPRVSMSSGAPSRGPAPAGRPYEGHLRSP